MTSDSIVAVKCIGSGKRQCSGFEVDRTAAEFIAVSGIGETHIVSIECIGPVKRCTACSNMDRAAAVSGIVSSECVDRIFTDRQIAIGKVDRAAARIRSCSCHLIVGECVCAIQQHITALHIHRAAVHF